jgi:ketosteroid isomerase-like protein
MWARSKAPRRCGATSKTGSTRSTNVSNVPEELVDLGDDRVLAVQRATGRARASGVETELRYAVVYTVRDGKISGGREYIDRATALEAARLRE